MQTGIATLENSMFFFLQKVNTTLEANDVLFGD